MVDVVHHQYMHNLTLRNAGHWLNDGLKLWAAALGVSRYDA